MGRALFPKIRLWMIFVQSVEGEKAGEKNRRCAPAYLSMHLTPVCVADAVRKTSYVLRRVFPSDAPRVGRAASKEGMPSAGFDGYLLFKPGT